MGDPEILPSWQELLGEEIGSDVLFFDLVEKPGGNLLQSGGSLECKIVISNVLKNSGLRRLSSRVLGNPPASISVHTLA